MKMEVLYNKKLWKKFCRLLEVDTHGNSEQYGVGFITYVAVLHKKCMGFTSAAQMSRSVKLYYYKKDKRVIDDNFMVLCSF